MSALKPKRTKQSFTPYGRNTPLSEVMTTEVVTVQINARGSVVDSLMRIHPIHHLPVLDGRVLCGVISQRDLYRNMLSDLYYDDERDLHTFLDRFTDIPSLMTPNPLSLAAYHTVGDALALMREHGIGSVPIVDGHNHLLGIVTDTDMLRILDAVLPE